MILVNLKRCVKKWRTFSKGVSKSGVLFRKVCQKVTHLPRHEKLSSKKVCQKVEHFSKRCVKKWRTFSKSASKSDTPIKISGFLGDSPNKMHENGLWPQNAYLAKDTWRTFNGIGKCTIFYVFMVKMYICWYFQHRNQKVCRCFQHKNAIPT